MQNLHTEAWPRNGVLAPEYRVDQYGKGSQARISRKRYCGNARCIAEGHSCGEWLRFHAHRADDQAVSHPSPTIHILHPRTLEKLHPSITSLPTSTPGSVPTYALSGRLLAFATTEAPPRPGSDGLGTLVTAQSSNRRSSSSSLASRSASTRATPQSQGDILTSAVEIGGGVARGVWAGIKMGARAANKARAGRLAQSAPMESSGVLADDDDHSENSNPGSPTESLEALGESLNAAPGAGGGKWIKIVDLGFGSRRAAMAGSKTHSSAPTSELRVIAHFRLPPSRSLAPLPPDTDLSRRTSPPLTRSQPIAVLSFNNNGTQLLAAREDGKVQYIFEIHPAGLSSQRLGAAGEVWHLYELRRGTTVGRVCEVSWSKDGRWVGVGTGKGTIRKSSLFVFVGHVLITDVYPISPLGGPPSSQSHVSVKNVNPLELHPLSTIVTAAARLRPKRIEATEEGTTAHGPGVFTFADIRIHPLEKGVVCQDISIFRAHTLQMELGRLSVRSAPAPQPSPHKSPHDHSGTAPGSRIAQRRGSALTEMMRAKAHFGPATGTDLEVRRAIKMRWMIPMGSASDSLLSVSSARQPPRAIKTGTRYVDRTSSSSEKVTHLSLTRAEITTHCSNPRILPSTIYLSRQINFFAARPIDEYSPLSILDDEARTRRLIFRPEVEARSTSPLSESFDQPLSSAIESVFGSPSSAPIPGLPNGHPSSSASMWRNIPIRHVAAGLGEGVDRVRREYARAQHSRARRRASQAAHNALSFEDEVVFPSSMPSMAGDGDGEGDGESSPNSTALPATNTDSSGEGDEGWGDGWEAEYARAVEEDGAPEELVLGLMDEEEEERRKLVRPEPKVKAKGGWK